MASQDKFLKKFYNCLVESLRESIGGSIVRRGCHVLNTKLKTEALERVAAELSLIVVYDAMQNIEASNDTAFDKLNHVSNFTSLRRTASA